MIFVIVIINTQDDMEIFNISVMDSREINEVDCRLQHAAPYSSSSASSSQFTKGSSAFTNVCLLTYSITNAVNVKFCRPKSYNWLNQMNICLLGIGNETGFWDILPFSPKYSKNHPLLAKCVLNMIENAFSAFCFMSLFMCKVGKKTSFPLPTSPLYLSCILIIELGNTDRNGSEVIIRIH